MWYADIARGANWIGQGESGRGPMWYANSAREADTVRQTTWSRPARMQGCEREGERLDLSGPGCVGCVSQGPFLLSVTFAERPSIIEIFLKAQLGRSQPINRV